MFRKSQSPAMVIAIVALIASLGGTAIAAKLITGKQIANGTVTGKDIKNKSLTKKDFKGSVKGATGPAGPAGPAGATGPQGPAGTPNGYTKTEADAAFLGKTAKAADAEKLDGVDGDDYVSGDAALGFRHLGRSANTALASFLTLGDIATVSVTCGAAGIKTLTLTNTSDDTLTVIRAMTNDNANPTVVPTQLVAAGAVAIAVSAGDYQVTLQVSRPAGNVTASADFSTAIISASDDGTDCTFLGQRIDHEKDSGIGEISG